MSREDVIEVMKIILRRLIYVRFKKYRETTVWTVRYIQKRIEIYLDLKKLIEL